MRSRVILANLLVPVVAYVAWDQYETRTLARQIAAIAARGEPTTLNAIPTGGDTPERYQAARVYAAAAEHVRALPQQITFRLPNLDVDSLVAPVNLDELERRYPPHAPALQLIDQAAALEFTGFGDLAPALPDGPPLTLAQLAALRADIFSARGDGDAAVRSLVACAGLWRTMPPRAFGRLQISSRLLASLRILFRHTSPSPAALAALQQALSAYPDADDLIEETRLRRARFLDDSAAPRPTLHETLVRRAMRPWIARSDRGQLEAFEEALAVAARPWPEKFAVAGEIERRYAAEFREPPRRGLFARQTAAPGVAFARFGLRTAGLELAARRVAIATVAVERYRAAHGGTPPPSVAALVPAYLAAVPADPFTGRPLAYASSATEYRLYSVDTDGTDDGGAIYGLGSRAQSSPPQGSPRDLGIRVAVRR